MDIRVAAQTIGLALAACGHYSFEPAVTPGVGDSGVGGDPDATLSVGLQVWITCDDITSRTLTDASGMGSTIQCAQGQCPQLELGTRGSACLFDGLDDVVTVSPDPRFQSRAFSAAVWLRLDSAPGGDLAAWLKHSATYDEVWAVYEQTDFAEDRLLAGTQSAGVSHYADLGAPTFGGWTHVALTYDGDQLRAYRDGDPVQSLSVGLIIDSAKELLLGAELEAANRTGHWPGALDDARFYDRVLSDAEIRALAP